MARTKNKPYFDAFGEVRLYTIDVTDLEALKLVEIELGKRVRFGAAVTRSLINIATALEIDVLAPLIVKLKKTPPEPVHPPPTFFVSLAQRNYVMMLIRKKIWTGRTGALQMGWQGVVYKRGGASGGVIMNVWNNRPYHKFVQGRVGMARTRSEMRALTKPMQPFHRKTGWKPAAPMIKKAVLKAEAISIDYLENAALEGLEKPKRRRRRVESLS
jgi:hypothetical protein